MEGKTEKRRADLERRGNDAITLWSGRFAKIFPADINSVSILIYDRIILPAFKFRIYQLLQKVFRTAGFRNIIYVDSLTETMAAKAKKGIHGMTSHADRTPFFINGDSTEIREHSVIRGIEVNEWEHVPFATQMISWVVVMGRAKNDVPNRKIRTEFPILSQGNHTYDAVMLRYGSA